MKIDKVLNIEELDLREALNDPFIFAMNCHYQHKHGDYSSEYIEKGITIPEPTELRCSCRPLCSMTAKSLKDVCNNPNKYVLIRLNLEEGDYT